MRRRDFLATSAAAALAGPALAAAPPKANAPPTLPAQDLREAFPRLQHDVFLNAAGGTPLSIFAEAGLRRHEEYWRLGPGDGRGEAGGVTMTGARERFARLIGADPDEIALVHCTKAGEQVVLDGLPALRERRGNVVTNDLHFSGSLHNLVGLQRAGLDVRIVRHRDWDVSAAAMAEAMDERTALVTVSLVSNINGRIEPIRQIADAAHGLGALVFADIIQAAGVYPIDVRAMEIDCAACSGYKWLFGPHGVGFLYVRRDLQGAALPDHLFPGHVRHNYVPWVTVPDPALGEFAYRSADDARRYQPGHLSYLGYAALYESLGVLETYGVEAANRHGVALCRRLLAGLDATRYRLISPHADRMPIVTLQVEDPAALEARLRRARIVASLAGNRLRVSPAVYNTESDIDQLLAVLAG